MESSSMVVGWKILCNILGSSSNVDGLRKNWKVGDVYSIFPFGVDFLI